MPTPNQSESPTALAFELASPQFRFPVKSVPSPSTASERTIETKQIQQAAEIAAPQSQAKTHAPHSGTAPPHYSAYQADRYVGWSIQDVSWINSLESESPRTGADPVANNSVTNETVLPSTPIAGSAQVETSVAKPSTEPDVSRPLARPFDLTFAPGTQPEAATHWSTSSRAQVTGFAIQRTQLPQNSTIVTGAGLASGHRRWAARNHSAELQARAVGLEWHEPAELQSEALPRNPGANPDEIVRARQAGALSGGLPLVVHPDFRWSPVVERLAAGGAFAQQLLAAADQLLLEGQGRLLFASTQRQQGVTTLAATIARMLIDRGRRVLMVDADLGRAGWTSCLELQAAGSWVRQVEAFEPLQAAMAISRRTSSALLGLHPIGRRQELPPYLFDYLGQLLTPFKGQFDATIVDVGPVSQLLEELSQPARLGTAVMVVQQGGTEAAIELRRNKTTLNAFGISRLAVARNFAA